MQNIKIGVKSLLLLLVINSLLKAQQIQTDNLTLTAPPPTPVQLVNVAVVGQQSNRTLYYFVVARYPIGNAIQSSPGVVINANVTLSASNYNAISWAGIQGATGYDLIRQDTITFTGSCTSCLIASNTSATNVLDQSNTTLGNYTLTGAPRATYSETLDNARQSTPQLTIDANPITTTKPTSNINIDNSTANKTTPIRTVTTLPSSCTGTEQVYYSAATTGQKIYACESNLFVLQGGTGGSGDVVGPASATDNALARFDGVTGKLIQNGVATEDDSGNLTANSIALGGATNGCDGTAGCIGFGAGTAPSSTTANTIKEYAPVAVTAYNVVKPSAAATGLYKATASGTTVTNSIGTASLTTDVTGILPLANGGTNCATPFVINPQTGTYQVVAADFTCFKTISVASGTFTITLVASGSQPVAGTWVKIINYGSGVITVARSGQNINGGTSNLTIAAASATAPTSAFITSDGTDYFGNITISSSSGSGSTCDWSTSKGNWIPFMGYTGAQTIGGAGHVVVLFELPPFPCTGSLNKLAIAATTSTDHIATAIYDSSLNLIQQSGTHTGLTAAGVETTLAATISATAGTTYYLAITGDTATVAYYVSSNSLLGTILNTDSTKRFFTCANASTGTTTLTFPGACGARTGANIDPPVTAFMQ